MRDSHVRAAILRRLDRDYRDDPNTRVVEEMGLWAGSVRVDIAVINGELSGIELKSDRDTLQRLPFQAEVYSRIFDRMELVVGSRHAEKAKSQVPDWWKITVATDNDGMIGLETIRLGDRNLMPDPLLIAQLLWKDEALAILETKGLAKGWRSKRTKLIHQRLASELPFAELSESVRATLKRRDGWLRQNLSRQLDVSVDADLNPALQVAGASSAAGDIVDTRVCPAVGERSSGGIGHDALSMPKQLLIHIDAAESGSAHAATNQKVLVEAVSDVNGKPPCDTLGWCIRRYRRVIAELKRIWQPETRKVSPEL
jgi:hypothetical protein